MSTTSSISALGDLRRGPPAVCIRLKNHYQNCNCEAIILCGLHGGRPYDGSATRWGVGHQRESLAEPEHYVSREDPREARVDKCFYCTEHVKNLLVATKAHIDRSPLAAGRRWINFLTPDEEDEPANESVLHDVTCRKSKSQTATLLSCKSHPDLASFIAACNIDYKIRDYPLSKYTHKLDQAILKHIRLERSEDICEQCPPD